ncbi:hypothetical protein CARUB_v10015006mg [Capsella rubella]|uniref:Glycine-rich protein n=1 Tax=Capsella rubella TaxID=81985 RepID=R0HPT8_9BRAS|nr:glycine-rich protein 3 short isoform [Capsella rubella]EOA31784.1 hypothetical protein CARUB_v10015006mg [Capsella rubella]
MASKTLLLLGLLAFLLIVSDMAVADTVKPKNEKTVQPDGGNGGHMSHLSDGGGYAGNGGYCRRGCCHRNERGCSGCCRYAGEAVTIQTGH